MKNAAWNPVLPISVCMADGEPHVFDDRVYLFGSHDTPGGESFCLEDYEFFSAPLNDLSSWSSKGTNYSAKQDPLYGENARYLYAPDVVQGNDGRYYLYYCLAGWKGKGGYHRLTHGSNYSRQMCAEPLSVRPDGSILQAEMTSCGLNGGDLPGKGEYPAAICCNLTNGKMPHIANQIRKDIPCVTHSGGEWYVGNAAKGTLAAYKCFTIQNHTKLCVTARGTGTMRISLKDECIGTLSFRCEKWTEAALVLPKSYAHAALRLAVTEGSLDILSLRFSPEGKNRCSEQITERIQDASFILSCLNNKSTPDS